MDESDIKIEVLSWARRLSRGRSLPAIASEYAIAGTNIRADLALLAETFIGVEIKSSADSLKRLPAQMEGYAKCFENVLLVAAPRHLRGLATINLCGAEVWSINNRGQMRCQSPGLINSVSGRELFGLLTQEERRRALRRLEASSSARPIGPFAIADLDARLAFEDAFRARYGQTSLAFWEAVKGRRIRREDLNLLSRFHSQRLLWEEAAQAHEAKWAHWVAAITNREVG